MSRHVIDSSRDEARELVDFLHNQSAFFRKHGGATLKHEADSLGNAAALLDSYQAGITLATPHAVTQASVIQWVSVSEALPADEEDVLIAIQRRLGGGLAWLHDFWSPQLDGIAYGLAMIFSLMLISGIIDLPFSLYQQFVIEARYGFNRMTLGLFFADLLKQTLVGIVIGAPVIAAVL